MNQFLTLIPDFIVMDEPVSNLDVSVRAAIIQLILDLQKKMGLTYLFIAHDLSLVKILCDEVNVMYLGKIMEAGTSDEIFESMIYQSFDFCSSYCRSYEKVKEDILDW